VVHFHELVFAIKCKGRGCRSGVREGIGSETRREKMTAKAPGVEYWSWKVGAEYWSWKVGVKISGCLLKIEAVEQCHYLASHPVIVGKRKSMRAL
jgi:hypothetical protein